MPVTWPIPDYGIPDACFEASWQCAGHEVRGLLRSGKRVLLHCKGGLGRTGMIAARLLIELGVPVEQAIRAVRRARPGAIDAGAQEAYVRHQRAITEA